jgi:hypothetical protein
MISKVCAAVALDSSCVSLSILLNTTWTSLSPSSFFANFSVERWAREVVEKEERTEPSVLYPLCREGKYQKALGQNLD